MAIKKSELYNSLWASCDELRGGMDASQYKDYVLFMLFIKYISDKYADSDDFAPPVTIPPGAGFKDKEHVSETLDDLEYGVDSKEIRSILLLFNLASLLEDPRSNIRFQFDSFKNGDWDIEHVRSVASSRPVRHNERLKWLELCLGYLETQDSEAELCTEMEAFIQLSQTEANEVDFDALYERVLACFKESDDEDVDDGIANLTLLDSSTNRSYKNAVFAVKRQRLLELDQSGIFVPLCTRNVFLKCYSPRVDNVMFWGDEDRQAYRSVMIDTLVGFFIGAGNQVMNYE
jgi:hypothetical protein